MTVPPAAAQVASRTSEGIAVRRALDPRLRRDAEPAEDRVEHAGRAARRRRTSTAAPTTTGGTTTGR